MKFDVSHGPYIKDGDNTSRIMKRLFIALLPIIFFAIYKNGYIPLQKGYIGFFEAFKPILMIMVSCLVSVSSEALFARFALKLKKDHFKSYLKHSYALFPGLFLSLVLPINTPLWLVALGSFGATIIGKMLFGGFGHNIFNPALIGYLLVTASYGSLIATNGGYLNGMEIDTISKATPLTNLSSLNYVGNWNNIGAHFGSLWDYFLGFIPGSIGSTSKILILLAMLYLIYTKVIKWIIPIFYIGTVFILTLIIGYINDIGLWYPLFQVLSGGLMFGAVFMATDPVTSPVSKNGQFLYAIGLGILTVVFRFLTPYPEGVLTSILTMNMFVYIIDRTGAKGKFVSYKIFIPLLILITIGIGTSIYIGNSINKPIVNEKVNIINVNKEGTNVTYDVTVKGFKGLIKADVIFENDKITKINIKEEHESYWQEIVNNDYLNKLIAGQERIKEVDTVSGATMSSTALKLMITEVLKHYESYR